MTSEELLQRATELQLAGDLGRARALYQRLLDATPLRALVLFRLGVLELQSQSPDKALPQIEAAIALEPGNARFHIGHGQALAALGRRPAAASAYEAAIRLLPEDPEALGGLGALLVETDPAAAEEQLRAAIAQAPGAVLHRVNLGILLCRQLRYSEAEPLLRTALGEHPGQLEAAFNLGIALQGLGRLVEAAAQYRFVVASSPDRTDALINLGNVLQELAEYSAAALPTKPRYEPLRPRSSP